MKKGCEVDTERCARQSTISPWHTTRQSQSGNTGDSERAFIPDASISDKRLSLGKLLRNGFVFSLKGENDSMLYHQSDPTTTDPLFLHKNSLRIHANPIVHHVSPDAEDDKPLRLSFPVNRQTRKRKFMSSHTLPPQPWCEQCVRGRSTENPQKRVDVGT